jgi:hypothetical protein
MCRRAGVATIDGGLAPFVAVLAALAALGACAAPVKEAPPPARTDETFRGVAAADAARAGAGQRAAGRWAQYEETYLGSVTIKERVALVGKGADGDTIETTTEMPSGEKTIFATLFAPAPDGGGAQVAASVFQVSDADPMQSPPVPPAQQPYPRVDPAKLVASTPSACASGLFRAKHYRERTAFGEQVDFWIDDSVGPIGLISLESEQKQHPTIRAVSSSSWPATGNDAIAQDHEARAAVRRVVAEEARAAVDAAVARRAAAAGEGDPMTHVGRHRATFSRFFEDLPR